jgi:hypothetical protein
MTKSFKKNIKIKEKIYLMKKKQKLTTLPVPRWSPTLVLGKPVGA